jgi:hypothetical protein
MCRYLPVFLLISLLLVPHFSNAAGPSFPSEMREIRDPFGIYAVTWERGGLSEDKPHQLFLKNLANGSVSKLLDFHRSVDVLWSHDGQFVAVTDWTGSNISQVLLFQPGKKIPVNMVDEIYRLLGEQPEISGNDHVYFEALDWGISEELSFKVFGHGDHDRGGFELLFEYNTSGRLKKIEPAQAVHSQLTIKSDEVIRNLRASLDLLKTAPQDKSFRVPTFNAYGLIGLTRTEIRSGLGEPEMCDTLMVAPCSNKGDWFYLFYKLPKMTAGGGPTLGLKFDEDDVCTSANWVRTQ